MIYPIANTSLYIWINEIDKVEQTHLKENSTWLRLNLIPKFGIIAYVRKLEFLVLKRLTGTICLVFFIVVMMLLWCVLPRVLNASVQLLFNEMITMVTQQQN